MVPGHSALTLVGCPVGLEAIFEACYNVFSLIAGLLHLKDDLELSYPGCWISSVVVTSDYLAKKYNKEMEEVVGRSGLYIRLYYLLMLHHFSSMKMWLV